MPASSRTARPESVVSPASSGSRRASPRARSVAPPSKVRSKPPLSGRDAAVRRAGRPRRRAAGRRARRRSRGRRRAWRCARYRPGPRSSPALKIDRPLPLTWSWRSSTGPPGLSAASAKRSTRLPSARATSGSADQRPVARPSTLTVTWRRRRVLEVLREAAQPQRHVLHLDVGGLQPVEDEEPVPAAGVAVVDVELGGVERWSARPAPAAPPAGPAGSPSEPVSVRLRRKLSAPVSRLPVRSSDRARDRDLVDAQAAGGLVDAVDRDRALAGEEVAELGGISGDEAAAEVGVEAEALVARRGARRRPRRCGRASASRLKSTSTSSRGPEPCSAGRSPGAPSIRSSVATTPPCGSCSATSMSSCRVAFEKAAVERERAAGASRRSMSRLVSSAPRASVSEPPARRSAAWPKTGSAKLMLGKSSSRRLIATGSSGSEKGCRLGAAAAWPRSRAPSRRGAATRRARRGAG